KEGAEAWENYKNLPPDQMSDEAMKNLLVLEIDSRLKNDVYELLGNLHAEEAVPILVEIMEHQEIYDLIPGMSPAMRAIAEIGPGAIPRLIESLENAQMTAASIWTSPDLSEEENRGIISCYSTRIQENVILVLEKIGDERALPALEKLLN